jgi:hypothetical protein
MTEIEYRVADLINFSSNQKPVDFEHAFKGVIAGKVADMIDARKTAVAQSMFASHDKQEENDVDDEVEDEAEEDINAEVA